MKTGPGVGNSGSGSLLGTAAAGSPSPSGNSIPVPNGSPQLHVPSSAAHTPNSQGSPSGGGPDRGSGGMSALGPHSPPPSHHSSLHQQHQQQQQQYIPPLASPSPGGDLSPGASIGLHQGSPPINAWGGHGGLMHHGQFGVSPHHPHQMPHQHLPSQHQHSHHHPHHMFGGSPHHHHGGGGGNPGAPDIKPPMNPSQAAMFQQYSWYQTGDAGMNTGLLT
eukprot:TRINITY_DN7172_c0_g1_i2.p1 TRINITY_DN7172_c0_g1~~TRINITY_DN7172_c0_g1_i2.p1  ORF type:complete len:220 (-),score=84.20 TRINITY_DN7172_c0_g1_i2:251-910(-)